MIQLSTLLSLGFIVTLNILDAYVRHVTEHYHQNCATLAGLLTNLAEVLAVGWFEMRYFFNF